MQPELAVLIAAYNSEATIRDALNSVLRSTVKCDVYIVDDASRVPVQDTLSPLPANVRILRMPANGGPAPARNAGLQIIVAKHYKYVSIVDADDTVDATLFAEQIALFESCLELGAASSWARHVDEITGASQFIHQTPAGPTAIRNRMFFNNAVVHSGVMIRTNVLRKLGLYSLAYPVAEDYELLRRIAGSYAMANVPKPLVTVRVSMNGISMQRRRRQLWDRLRIQHKYFAPTQWRAWAGMLQAIVSLALPKGCLHAAKKAIPILFPKYWNSYGHAR